MVEIRRTALERYSARYYQSFSAFGHDLRNRIQENILYGPAKILLFSLGGANNVLPDRVCWWAILPGYALKKAEIKGSQLEFF